MSGTLEPDKRMTGRLLDGLRRLDEHVVPRAGSALARLHTPGWAQRISARVNRYMPSSPWQDRYEPKLYLGLVVGTFALLWIPLVIVDALTTTSHDQNTGADVERVTDAILFVVAVIVAAIGVRISRRWRNRRR